MPKYVVPALALALVLTGAGCATQTEEVTEDTSMMMEAVQLTDGAYALAGGETVTWGAGKLVGNSHNGTVAVSEGSLTVEEGMITGGSVVMDMSTITDLDLEGAGKESLETHLMSEDFFAVETYPTATFTITETSPLEGIEGSNYRVDGVMTIRGIDQEISFPGMVSEDGGVITLTADLELDRTQWDVNYGSGSIFDDLGDAVIKDEFQLGINLSFSSADAMMEDDSMMGEEN